MEDLKTQVISFNNDKKSANDEKKVESQIINYDDKYETLPAKPVFSKQKDTFGIENIQVETLKQNIDTTTAFSQVQLNTRPVKILNPNFQYFPKFYISEFKRYFRLFIYWIVLVCIVLALIGVAIWAIITSPVVNDWCCLLLVPPIILSFAGLIVYTDKYYNFRTEAKTINFGIEKVISINVVKLYKRLKTGDVNVNWMCCLAYVVGALVITFTYVAAWAQTNTSIWGIAPSLHNGDFIYLALVISSGVGMFVAFFFHVYLLLSNYMRANKIDNYYAVQIVSTEELSLIRKKKNKRDFIIFFLVVMFLVLIGILIYKLVKKNSKNNIVINN